MTLVIIAYNSVIIVTGFADVGNALSAELEGAVDAMAAVGGQSGIRLN